MSEKIVQLNEEIIKGQIKELVRGSVEETYDVKASDDPDASAFGYAFVSDDTFSVVILSDPELSFAFAASDKS